MPEIVTIGELLVEIMAETVGQSFAVPGRYLGPYPSGAPAIFADQAARLGIPTSLIATIGEDDFGTLALERLRRDGVETGAIRRVPGATTGTAFVTYAADGARHFIFHLADAAPGQLAASDLDPAMFAECRTLHIMGSSLFSPGIIRAVERAIALATEAGARLSFDPNIREPLLRQPGVAEAIRGIAARAEILMPSEADLAFLCPGTAIDTAIDGLLSQGTQCVFLKRGAGGTLYADRTQRIATPAFAVREIDPTGAGDCTGATFLAGLLRDLPLEAMLRRANAAGALAVGARGPMEGNSDAASLAAFITTANPR
jgi:fructokinase